MAPSVATPDQCLADDLFRDATRTAEEAGIPFIDIGGVDEVDPVIKGKVRKPDGIGFGPPAEAIALARRSARAGSTLLHIRGHIR